MMNLPGPARRKPLNRRHLPSSRASPPAASAAAAGGGTSRRGSGTSARDGASRQSSVRADTTVRVRANSWIELRAPNGDVLAQTYVRGGESYVVPAGIAYRIVDRLSSVRSSLLTGGL